MPTALEVHDPLLVHAADEYAPMIPPPLAVLDMDKNSRLLPVQDLLYIKFNCKKSTKFVLISFTLPRDCAM